MNEQLYLSERLDALEARLARIEVAIQSIARERLAGVVYVVADDAGRHKIGKSVDVDTRLKSIATDNSAAKLVLTIETDDRHALETALHKIFRRAQRHISGEWYALTPSDVVFLKSLPSPFFKSDLARLSAAKLPICKTAAPPQHAQGTVAAAPVTNNTAALFCSGVPVSKIVVMLHGVNTKGGGRYQKASKHIQEELRRALLAVDIEQLQGECKTIAQLFQEGMNISQIAITRYGGSSRGGRAYQMGCERVAALLRQALAG